MDRRAGGRRGRHARPAGQDEARRPVNPGPEVVTRHLDRADPRRVDHPNLVTAGPLDAEVGQGPARRHAEEAVEPLDPDTQPLARAGVRQAVQQARDPDAHLVVLGPGLDDAARLPPAEVHAEERRAVAWQGEQPGPRPLDVRQRQGADQAVPRRQPSERRPSEAGTT